MREHMFGMMPAANCAIAAAMTAVIAAVGTA